MIEALALYIGMGFLVTAMLSVLYIGIYKDDPKGRRGAMLRLLWALWLLYTFILITLVLRGTVSLSI